MDAFYVDSPHSVSSRLAAELTISPASSHLLVGGVGSGKTTELLAIQRRMASLADTAALNIDVMWPIRQTYDTVGGVPAEDVAVTGGLEAAGRDVGA
jgi:hypothetical protein